MAKTTAEAPSYLTKKLNSKTQSTTFTDQHKSTKKRVSTKPIFKGKSRSDDYEITKLIQKKINNNIQVRVVDYNPNPIETLLEVGKCDSFIGMRYHSCLFAYLNNKPLLIIGYFQKCLSLAEKIKLTEKAIISIEDILEGKFGDYLNNLDNNPDDYTGKLSEDTAKKQAISFIDNLK
jgi:polysaccharide pyruvyl transferase WcaK-like protein